LWEKWKKKLERGKGNTKEGIGRNKKVYRSKEGRIQRIQSKELNTTKHEELEVVNG